MQIVENISELKPLVKSLKQGGKVGFVPTMGALHQGHLSLVNESVEKDNSTVVSIFVNPTQFNNKNDLKSYPRNTEQDLALLKPTGCDVVFIPSVEEMYPEEDTREFKLGLLDKVMEGLHRPGHFNEVAQVVTKLFDMVEPDRAYFGQKDFQQLAVIKKVVKDCAYNIEIIPCATIRENDGLAMSSRNLLLEDKKREASPIIYKALSEIPDQIPTSTPNEIKEHVEDLFKGQGELELEYFDLVDSLTLESIKEWHNSESVTACIAAFAGKVRLIDNLSLY